MNNPYREVSEWLNKINVAQPIDKQEFSPNLRQVRGQMAKQYKKPKLNDAGGDISKRWFVYFSYVDSATGKYERFKVYLDINSYKTKGERQEYASLLIKSLIELLDAGYNPFLSSSEQDIGEVQTLDQAIPAYLHVKETQLRGKTITGYKSTLKQFSLWAAVRGHLHKPLKQMTAEEVQDYFTQARKNRKISTTTHNSELTTLRSFFSYWHKKQLITTNPALGIKRLREEIGTHTVYNDRQIQQITDLLESLNTPRSKQLLQFIRFIYYACIRPKELKQLKIGDIRPLTKTLLVPASTSKSGRTEPIDISPGLQEVLTDMNLDYSQPNWYIFGNQSKGVFGDYSDARPGPKPVGNNYFTRYYRGVLKKLGLSQDYTLYAWKHTRNVHLYMHDKDLLRLMRHNRHTDPKVTMRYLRSLGLLVDTRLTDERRI